MKVLLNGATAGSNFGDFLFAKMFQEEISQYVGLNNVYWYKSRYALSQFFITHLNYYRNYHLRDIDALVFISGGYFCGDDHCLKDYIIRYLRYFHIGICCLIYKIPIAIIAVEVGPTKNCILRFIEKVILKKAQVLLVRNAESEFYALEMGRNKKVVCTADSVFAMKRSLFSNSSIPDEIKLSKKLKLFFHINPSIKGNSSIVQKIVPIVNEFCSRHPEYAIVVSTDQYVENQRKIFDDFCSHLNAETVYFNEYNDPTSLCKVLDQCNLIVTHKLHVGIVGAYLGKSVISFSGHTEKIERLYKQLNVLNRTTPLSTLTFEKGIEMMEENYNKPVSVPEFVTNLAEKNFEYLTSFISSLQKSFD